MYERLPVLAAALWWGSLSAIGFVAVPMLFAHLPTPVADAIGERLLGVPFYPGLAADAIDEIAAAAPDVGRPVIELWLHLHWACRRPSGRPETEDLADVHASHGALLTEITSQVQEAQ